MFECLKEYYQVFIHSPQGKKFRDRVNYVIEKGAVVDDDTIVEVFSLFVSIPQPSFVELCKMTRFHMLLKDRAEKTDFTDLNRKLCRILDGRKLDHAHHKGDTSTGECNDATKSLLVDKLKTRWDNAKDTGKCQHQEQHSLQSRYPAPIM